MNILYSIKKYKKLLAGKDLALFSLLNILLILAVGLVNYFYFKEEIIKDSRLSSTRINDFFVSELNTELKNLRNKGILPQPTFLLKKFKFEEPRISTKTGSMILPISLATSSIQKRDISESTIEIDLITLSEKIRDFLLSDSTYVIIIDKNLNTLMELGYESHFSKGLFNNALFDSSFFTDRMEGPLNKKDPDGKLKYLYFKNIPSTPYTIIVVVPETIFWIKYLKGFFVILIYLTFISVSALTLILFYRKKEASFYLKSSKNEEIFLSDLKKVSLSELHKARGCYEILSKNFNGETRLSPLIKSQVLKTFLTASENLCDYYSDELHHKECRLEDLTESLESLFCYKCQKKNINLSIRLQEPQNQTLWCDPIRIRQALASLIEFSVQHRDKEGFISISVTSSETDWIIIMEDDAFFFDEGERDRYSDSPSSGSPLPIFYRTVQKIISSHHGNLEILPRSPIGNSITVKIPKNRKTISSSNVHKIY